jgi:hypothetical protein
MDMSNEMANCLGFDGGGGSMKLRVSLVCLLLIVSAFVGVNLTTDNARAVTYFQDDFEPGPLAGWVADGLWTVRDDSTTTCAPPNANSPTHTYWYGLEANCDYDTPALRNMGNLTSPMIDLTGAAGPVRLAFWTIFNTEPGVRMEYDQMWVKASTDNFVSVDVPLGQIWDPMIPMNVWTLIELNLTSFAGNTVWIRFHFDTIDDFQNNFEGWLIDDVIVDDIAVSSNIVTVEAWNRAPPYVEPGMVTVPMLQLNFTSSPGSTQLTSFKVDLTGNLVTSNDVNWVYLYLDADGNDVYNPVNDMLIGSDQFPAPPGPYSMIIPLSIFSVMVNPGAPTKIFVVYDIEPAPPATIGHWIGVSIADQTYIGVDIPNKVAPFPGINTYALGISTEIRLPSTQQLIVEAWDRSPSVAEISEPDVLMLQLNLSVSGGTGLIIVRHVKINLTGVPPDGNDISDVTLWLDADSNDILNTQVDVFLSQNPFPIFPPYQTTLWLMGGNVLYPGMQWKLFITYTINTQPPATPGDYVGARIDNASSFLVGSPDAVAPFGGVDTYSPGVKTQLLVPSAEELLIEAWDIAPLFVVPGQLDVPMIRLNMSVNNPTGIILLTDIEVMLSGSPPTSNDTSSLDLYEDANSNSILDPSDTWLDFQNFSPAPCPCTATFSLSSPIVITAGTNKTLFISYNIADLPTVTVGNWIGAAIIDITDFTVNPPDTIGPFTLMNTYVPGVKTVIGQVDTLEVEGVPKTSGTVLPGATDVLMEQLKLNTSSGSIMVTDIRVDQTGDAVDADSGNVYLYNDTNEDGLHDAFDVLLDTRTFSGKTLTFTGLSIMVNPGSNISLLIVLDVDPLATTGRTLKVTLMTNSYITVTIPDEVASFLPINSNVVTILDPASDLVAVNGTAKASGTALMGEANVVVEQLNVTVSAGTATVTSIKIDELGTAIDADTEEILLYDDVNGDGDLDAGDALLNVQTFVGNTLTFSPLAVTVNAGVPEYLLVVMNVSVMATAGNTLRLGLGTNTYVAVAAPDVVSVANFPITSNTITIQAPPGDIVSVSGVPLASGNVFIGETNVAMEQLTISVNANTAIVTDIQLDEIGTGADADTGDIRLFDDVNDDGVLDIGTDVLLDTKTFIGGTLTFTGLTMTVISGTPENLLVVYNITACATAGNTLRGSIASNVSLTVIAPDSVSSANFPINSNTVTIVASALTVAGTAVASGDVNPGETDIVMEELTLTSNLGTITVTSVKVDQTGTGVDADTGGITLYWDVNGDGLPDAGDTLLGAGTFSTKTLTFSGLSVNVVSGTPVNLLIVYNVTATATLGNTLRASLVDNTYITVSSPAVVSPFAAINSNFVTIQEFVATTANITGTVLDENSEPVAGANVTLTNSTGNVVAVVQTNATGVFLFSNIEARDDYAVTVEQDYYGTHMNEDVDLVAGVDKNLGTIVLDTDAKISGTVKKSDGSAMEGATVKLIDGNGNEINTTTTDSEGNYTFGGVGYGNYTVRVTAAGYEDATSDPVTINKDNLDETVPDIHLEISTGEPPDGAQDDYWQLILAILLIVLLLLCILLWFVRRKKKPEEAMPTSRTEDGEPTSSNSESETEAPPRSLSDRADEKDPSSAK